MQQVYVVADNIVGPLGGTTRENFDQVLSGNSGIAQHNNAAYAAAPFYGAITTPAQLDAFTANANVKGYTRFEQLLVASIQSALRQTAVTLTDARTGFIISTTKGNIELLEQQPEGAVPPLANMQLYTTAKKVAAHFNAANEPLVISSACISGLVAILTGKRLIQSGRYDHVVVTGADVLTRFVLSGFQSFQAVSAVPCKPFDANRTGVTLGEGAATVILSREKGDALFSLGAGAISNDANHISGPSRTGEELAAVMQLAVNGSGLTAADIGFVSAHGTATLYNDEMEAKALHHAGLAALPVNSLKGYYGHTLGAAGLIEAIISMQAMKAGVVLPTKGFEIPGVSMPVNVHNTLLQKTSRHFLKTVSGFGGCNAAMVFNLNS
ncbi:beta-ketoacyl synthase N-terminal-like domain-containing protein [Chitinophaga ginsengisegetis]|uniref:beta-ketoacyl synthase N-terminal-like domain-containing protein n=1 Tax=Chitinophaga ginsengisegetis TaxID=393003 RepID=UPI000DBA280F|nr:beta-ketoacyl synthase N-terminal-like domain-containing protein [Chitinophaga ginsengisegetis]MDR6567005.1 3-oxoacyl-[acyl-carrier-protein] synthase-1 [Chitinophaga ginsengisegetis]MDR6646735.1 3-oxoacyl-[acyl-carrier-protein] synthase-1 [Chitinophaga ginsengisegetis]MDR6653085.1 3-oxoacyl-[acyl-carrier-protein] synthase-1 [Chitinophaga ginsengisegetis]